MQVAFTEWVESVTAWSFYHWSPFIR